MVVTGFFVLCELLACTASCAVLYSFMGWVGGITGDGKKVLQV